MADNFQQNQIITDKLNMDESSLLNNKKEELMTHLKEVHCKNEERTFDLNEKFNQIKEELQNIMEEYKSNNDEDKNEYENNELDIISIKDYIKDYINNERNISINVINDSFEKINNNFEEIVENNNTNLAEIENTLNEIKNAFEQNINNTINHTIEISSQKDEINDKLNVQLQEQFDKINRIIEEEKSNLSNAQIDNIKKIKTLINNILKYIKKEKIQ